MESPIRIVIDLVSGLRYTHVISGNDIERDFVNFLSILKTNDQFVKLSTGHEINTKYLVAFKKLEEN
jgi:hypothetical protein